MTIQSLTLPPSRYVFPGLRVAGKHSEALQELANDLEPRSEAVIGSSNPADPVQTRSKGKPEDHQGDPRSRAHKAKGIHALELPNQWNPRSGAPKSRKSIPWSSRSMKSLPWSCQIKEILSKSTIWLVKQSVRHCQTDADSVKRPLNGLPNVKRNAPDRPESPKSV